VRSNAMKYVSLFSLYHCSALAQSQPITAVMGDDITLPCHVTPVQDVSEQMVEWSKLRTEPRFVHVRRSGEDRLVDQNPEFSRRTSMSLGGLTRGDVSLTLSRVRLSDEGTYRCFIPSLKMDTTVQLDTWSLLDLQTQSEVLMTSILSASPVESTRTGPTRPGRPSSRSQVGTTTALNRPEGPRSGSRSTASLFKGAGDFCDQFFLRSVHPQSYPQYHESVRLSVIPQLNLLHYCEQFLSSIHQKLTMCFTNRLRRELGI
uniref:Ig-like domain-containing protein n=1 Tax=Sphaeramia orbicularis TaxID=375764 RepID=A0A672Z9V9_9TELE